MKKNKIILILIGYIAFVFIIYPFSNSLSSSLYKLEKISEDTLKVIVNIHLIPPASRLIHKEIKFKEIESLPSGKEIKEKALVDVKFFKSQIKKDMDIKREIKLEDALFNIYQDMHGIYTDPIYIIYKFVN